jgi:hypothetical protein
MYPVFLDLHGGLAVDTGGAAAHPQAVTRLNHRLHMEACHVMCTAVLIG